MLFPQIRGAVWFEATVYGQAGRSGKPGGTVAPFKAIDIVGYFTDNTTASSRATGKYPLFDQFGTRCR